MVYGFFVSLNQSRHFLLQPVLQELGKQNPNLLRMIQENHAEFLQLINEPVDGSEGWVWLPYRVFVIIIIIFSSLQPLFPSSHFP